jgi:subtilisin family serine protease
MQNRVLHRLRLVFGTALLIVLICISLPGFAQQGAHEYARGHILVKFRDNADSNTIYNALKKVRFTRTQSLGRLKVQRVGLPANMRETDAVAALRAAPGVEFAELDRKVKISITPNDPGYPNQWHLPNISAPQAWDLSIGSNALVIAVIDTGCDPNHPDLSASYVSGWNFVDGNSNWSDVEGHGTEVAGSAAAVGNNSTGVVGVSWNTRIMPLRVADANGSAYFSTIATALNYAADNGAKIANISFDSIPGSSTVLNAAQYMWNKGGLTVVAAGNSGIDPGFSASPYLIVVSATNKSNAKTSWSNYGSFVTVSAPGESIYTTTRGGGYRSVSGTSYASPITCGSLAVIWSSNRYLSNAQVRNILTSSATDLGTAGFDTSFGYGKVNVYNGVVLAQQTSVDTTAPTVYITDPAAGATVSGTKTVTIQASDNVGVTRVELFVDGALTATLTNAPYTYNWNTMSVPNGAHTLTAKAYDQAGNVGNASPVSVTVSNALDTTAPTVTITSPANGARVGRNVSVTVEASDNVAVTKVELYLNGKLTASSTSANPTFNLNTRKWATGSHTLQAFAYDARGNKGSSAIVTVQK